ncbi:MAG: hypothetical protein LBF86_02530 [Helicobacteraceae bacterium]|jgi:hypothetical protein|nr:hypothetical protein [Helicobacteraceae bacterium]
MSATADFKFETNGTVEVSFAGLGVFTGAYVVKDGYQVTFFDFEGIAAYSYAVIDNNTISVTEGEFDGVGGFTAENTTSFKRKASSQIIKQDIAADLSKPSNADNNLTGAWQALLPPETEDDGYSKTIQVFLPNGDYQYLSVDPYMSMQFQYSTINDVFFIFLPPYGAEAFQYATKTDGNITVTPIIGVNENGRILDASKATDFTKIW